MSSLANCWPFALLLLFITSAYVSSLETFDTFDRLAEESFLNEDQDETTTDSYADDSTTVNSGGQFAESSTETNEHIDDPLQKILPKVRFNCKGKSEGYYADRDFCELFHYCKTNGFRFTFICPPKSYFNNDTMSCEHNSTDPRMDCLNSNHTSNQTSDNSQAYGSTNEQIVVRLNSSSIGDSHRAHASIADPYLTRWRTPFGSRVRNLDREMSGQNNRIYRDNYDRKSSSSGLMAANELDGSSPFPTKPKWSELISSGYNSALHQYMYGNSFNRTSASDAHNDSSSTPIDVSVNSSQVFNSESFDSYEQMNETESTLKDNKMIVNSTSETIATKMVSGGQPFQLNDYIYNQTKRQLIPESIQFQKYNSKANYPRNVVRPLTKPKPKPNPPQMFITYQKTQSPSGSSLISNYRPNNMIYADEPKPSYATPLMNTNQEYYDRNLFQSLPVFGDDSIGESSNQNLGVPMFTSPSPINSNQRPSTLASFANMMDALNRLQSINTNSWPPIESPPKKTFSRLKILTPEKGGASRRLIENRTKTESIAMLSIPVLVPTTLPTDIPAHTIAAHSHLRPTIIPLLEKGQEIPAYVLHLDEKYQHSPSAGQKRVRTKRQAYGNPYSSEPFINSRYYPILMASSDDLDSYMGPAINLYSVPQSALRVSRNPNSILRPSSQQSLPFYTLPASAPPERYRPLGPNMMASDFVDLNSNLFNLANYPNGQYGQNRPPFFGPQTNDPGFRPVSLRRPSHRRPPNREKIPGDAKNDTKEPKDKTEKTAASQSQENQQKINLPPNQVVVEKVAGGRQITIPANRQTPIRLELNSRSYNNPMVSELFSQIQSDQLSDAIRSFNTRNNPYAFDGYQYSPNSGPQGLNDQFYGPASNQLYPSNGYLSQPFPPIPEFGSPDYRLPYIDIPDPTRGVVFPPRAPYSTPIRDQQANQTFAKESETTKNDNSFKPSNYYDKNGDKLPKSETNRTSNDDGVTVKSQEVVKNLESATSARLTQSKNNDLHKNHNYDHNEPSITVTKSIAINDTIKGKKRQ